MSEEWRAIPGFPLYEVSNMGRIRSVPRMVRGPCGRIQRRAGASIAAIRVNGYSMVGLYEGSNRVRRGVHRLVLLAFVGPPPFEDSEARHINGNASDNRLENLIWGTPRDNAADRDEHGNTLRGERNGFAKLTAEQVANIRAATGSRRQIGARFGISGTHVQRIRSGERWSHTIAAAQEPPHDR